MDVNQIVEKYPHTLQAIRSYLGLPVYQAALVVVFAKKGSQIERRRLRNAIQSIRTKPMEELRYLPSIDLCLVTRGTLQNGNPSRASIWTSTKIRQHSNDRRYYLYRDTYDHVNPLIYSRPHLTEYTEYYLKKLTEFSQHHRDNLFKNLKRKKLHGPYVTTLQQFDACRHRKIFAQYNVLVPAYMETAWEAIIDNQCAAYDKKISFTEQ